MAGVCALACEFQMQKERRFTGIIDLRDGAGRSGVARDLTIFFPLARIDLPRDVVRDLPTHHPVDGQLV
jgi:hypothetical protein